MGGVALTYPVLKAGEKETKERLQSGCKTGGSCGRLGKTKSEKKTERQERRWLSLIGGGSFRTPAALKRAHDTQKKGERASSESLSQPTGLR